jgi:CheY-like chemotaxis protein/anti-sigma regulatory factor (Ser/Thr protein kinase)
MRILFADNDDHIRCATQTVLEQMGHIVSTFPDGQMALLALQAGPSLFDCILIDHNLSGINGISFTSAVHANDALRGKPVVIFASDHNAGGLTESMAAGAHLYLTKTASKSLLKAVLHQIATGLQERQELEIHLQETRGGLALTNYAEFSFRTITEAKMLAAVLADMSCKPERTIVGYSELLTNAVEHGNLEISYAEKSTFLFEGQMNEELDRRIKHPTLGARKVSVKAEREFGNLTGRIEDEGSGFNWIPFLDFDPERAFDLHGRGIAICKHLAFDELHYEGKGNVVEVTVYEKPVK